MSKGTKVQVRTTNGGEIVATLNQSYRPTYDVVLDINQSWIIIPAFRIKSITAVGA